MCYDHPADEGAGKPARSVPLGTTDLGTLTLVAPDYQDTTFTWVISGTDAAQFQAITGTGARRKSSRLGLGGLFSRRG